MKKFLTLKIGFTCLALIAVASSSFADMTKEELQSFRHRTFVQRPGIEEFSGKMIVRPLQFNDAVEQTGSNVAARQLHKRAIARLQSVVRYYGDIDVYVVRLPRGMDENAYAGQMLATGDYEYVEPDWTVYPALTPNDPFFGTQWHHQTMHSPQGWDLWTGSSSITCAFTDTGVDHNHADLGPALVPGYNSASHTREVDGGDTSDINGHGTHVAGDGAAIGNNAVGVVGEGWNFRIMPIRVTNNSDGSAAFSNIAEGGRWAVDNGAKVISASYSGVSNSLTQTTGDYVRQHGGLYMYAAGNDSSNLSSFDWADVVVVGATDRGDVKASFSAFGHAVDVFAPGVNIYSTTRGGSYGFLSGTSMATPIANGVATLIWSTNLNLTSNQVEAILEESCRDLGTAGNDDFWGWGRVDVYNAMQAARLSSVLPTSFSVFRGTQVSGSLTSLFNSDDDYVVVQNGVTALRTESPITVTIIGTSPIQVASIFNFTVENHVSITGLTQRIEFYDFVAARYEEEDARSATTADSVTVAIGTSPSRFIEPGTNLVTSQVRIRADGPVFTNSWTSSIDQAVWSMQ